MADQDQSEGLSRRRFLTAAGGGAAALALGNIKLPSAEAAALPPVRGFMDGWNEVLTGWGVTFGKWAASPSNNGSVRYVRQIIDWNEVQNGGPGAFDFTRYWALREHLREWNTENPQRPLRILPVCMGCPQWAQPWGYQCPVYWNWCHESHDGQFGTFVAETLKYFDAPGYRLVDAVEIWNEPNTPEFGAVPYSRFAGLVWNGQYYAGLYYQQGNYSRPMTVLAGGIAMFGPASKTSTCVQGGTSPPGEGGSMNGWSYENGKFVRIPMTWQTYLKSFQESIQWSTFDLGIHPYVFSSEGTAAKILTLFDEAKNLTVQASGVPLRNLWVTETGCSSRSPWGQQGQQDVLLSVTEGLAQRSRCKAMIVYRMWDDSEPANSPFVGYGLGRLTPAEEKKQAWWALHAAWA
ncbi:MAG TPA: twin-arginine translocation signal domain-containing protein [Solirubrobacterales bacterium]|nr:twin-arginine translocation signal domain-containing protein [Solirubrobacterales bacterium]